MTRSKVLLVDDEAVVRESVAEWLRDDQCDVACAKDGEEAVNRARSERFDTAVIDLKLPGIDGLETTRRIKAGKPEIRIVIITAYGSAESAVEAMKRGASDYLIKPFTMEQLQTAIGIAPPPVAPREAPPATAAPKKVEEKQCIWSKTGAVSYRACLNKFQCDTCDFAQSILDNPDAAGGRCAVKEAIEKMLEQPGAQRACRYMLSGHASYRLCSRLYQCERCAFNEFMEDRLEFETGRMINRLQTLRERATQPEEYDDGGR